MYPIFLSDKPFYHFCKKGETHGYGARVSCSLLIHYVFNISYIVFAVVCVIIDTTEVFYTINNFKKSPHHNNRKHLTFANTYLKSISRGYIFLIMIALIRTGFYITQIEAFGKFNTEYCMTYDREEYYCRNYDGPKVTSTTTAA